MKSFAIGLALLASGFAAYVLTSALKSVTVALTALSAFLQKGEALPEGWGTLAVGGIPQGVLNVAPYICLGIMVFGVAWFWLIEPLLYLAAPPKKEAGREMPPVPSAPGVTRAEPMAPGSKVEQWIIEAICEKMEREKGK